MWHRRRRKRLGVTTPHRKALLRNLVKGLARHREVETTYARAKETARLADRMVTLAKEGTLAARRQLIRRLGSSQAAKTFIDEIAPRLQDRNGGYTRVLKLGNRSGDGARTALVQFSVPIEIAPSKVKPKKEKEPKTPKEEKPRKGPAPEKEKKPKLEKETEKEETEKRGGFLSKLRKFLTGEEEKK